MQPVSSSCAVSPLPVTVGEGAPLQVHTVRTLCQKPLPAHGWVGFQCVSSSHSANPQGRPCGVH